MAAIRRISRRSAQSRRREDREEGFLLMTLAQTTLCVLMLAAAFVMSSQMGMTGLKQAFSSLLSEETQALEVFGSVQTTEASGWEDRAKAFIQALLEQFGGRGSAQEPLGAGGELSAEPQDDGGFRLPQGILAERVRLSAPLSSPLSGEVTSPFGLREHPITGKPDFHTGVDIAAPAGTPIAAAYPGRVSEVGVSDIYGNFVLLDHGGVQTRYCHCESVWVRTGMLLRAGEHIAAVGSTGVSTGPHLHFELLVDGRCTDPLAEGIFAV